MQLTKYHVMPADGGWRVVSTLGRTRFDGQVFSWTQACRLRERLMVRQAQIYGDQAQLRHDEVRSDRSVGPDDELGAPVRRSTH